MATRVLKTFLVTSDPIDKYGGVQLSPDLMPLIVEQIRAGKMPWHIEHDARRTFQPRLLLAEVRPTGTGSVGVWVEIEVDERDWERAAHTKGFSAAVIGDPFHLDSDTDKPGVMIAADAAHFDEQVLSAAVADLRPYFAVSGGRLYQFADVSPAKVIIEWLTVTPKDLWVGLVAGGMIEAVKRLLKPKEANQTVFEFRVKTPQQTTTGRLETNDAAIAKDALLAFHDVATQGQGTVHEYDPAQHRWVEYLEDAVPEPQPLDEAGSLQPGD